MAKVSVRYIVDDVDAAIDFYCTELGFHEVMHPAPSFAMLSRDDLRLVLSAPSGGPGGGQSMPDGTLPQPGGWNRFQLEVDDIEETVARLRERGARFRNEIITGVGGKQTLVEDPSGNPIELFQPTLPEAKLRHRLTPKQVTTSHQLVVSRFATSASVDRAALTVVANVDRDYRDLANAGKAHIDAARPTTRPA